MASEGRTYLETVGRWKVLDSNLEPQIESMPHLAARRVDLQKMIAEGETLETRQAALKAELQEVNRRRRELIKTGEDLRNRIGAILKAEHGFTSKRLLEFGLKPKRFRGRAKPQDGEPTPPPETTQPATK